MYIIWKYDMFPYKLCGKVSKKVNDKYTVEGYGTMLFTPIRVIPDDNKGQKVKEMLERELDAKRIEQRQLDERFDSIVAQSLVMILGL